MTIFQIIFVTEYNACSSEWMPQDLPGLLDRLHLQVFLYLIATKDQVHFAVVCISVFKSLFVQTCATRARSPSMCNSPFRRCISPRRAPNRDDFPDPTCLTNTQQFFNILVIVGTCPHPKLNAKGWWDKTRTTQDCWWRMQIIFLRL